jgi:hypothetical protein
MKLTITCVLVFAGLTGHVLSQTIAPTAQSAFANWTATSRGECSTVWQITGSLSNDASGSSIPQSHTVTEVSSGLNYLENGQWRQSIEVIEATTNGFAAALHGPNRVYFDPDPTADAAITSERERRHGNRVLRIGRE